MILYLIGGLGADERVFKDLKLNCETKSIKWIEPLRNESLSSYATRLVSQINQNEKFGILGVSFGGIVAIELANICKPEVLILVSSIETDDQLPLKYLDYLKIGLLNLIPDALIKPPRFVLGYLFGAKNKKLIYQIINDTNPRFIKWALIQIVTWKNQSNQFKPFRIHGSNDKLIPLKGQAIQIENGSHFMIVDKAAEISEIINEYLEALNDLD